MRQNPVRLDSSKLLGFRLAEQGERKSRLGAKVGGKLGTKAGVKAGTKR